LRETEKRNPNSEAIDLKSIEEILRIINDEDRKISRAVANEIPQISVAVEAIIDTIKGGGRVFFVGAGTSGRMGVIEAAELPPTFGLSSDLFKGIIAGGPKAIVESVEEEEDDLPSGKKVLEAQGLGGKDLLLALSASGKTPFVLGALRQAHKERAKTIALTCSRNSPMEEMSDISIVVDTGAEIVAGSTRMKAATAQKLVLNMLTTTAMIKLHKVYNGYMIGVQPTSEKLRERSVNIIREIARVDVDEASKIFEASGWELKLAIIMARGNISKNQARKLLAKTKDSLRLSLEIIGESF
jgi:N-acetylmuramic acid 6-phosphate etherase